MAVIVLVLSAVFGALGCGLLLTVVAKTPSQGAKISTAMMLALGVLGSRFYDISAMPQWLRWISFITPNAWALQGFTDLAEGDGFAGIAVPVAGLLAMGVILFALTVFLFLRRGGLRQ